MFALKAHAAQASTARISREKLFFWLFLILATNSLSGLIIRSVMETSVASALALTFGVSAIVWLAVAAGLALLIQPDECHTPTSNDIWVAAPAFALALVPIANFSSVALTLVAAYGIVTSAPGSSVRRAGAIFLAVTANLIWGRLILGLFSRSFLFIDAFLVTNLLGTTQVGNTIPFLNHSGFIIVAPGCSSLQGISLAIVFWVTVQQWFRLPVTLFSILWCFLATLAAVVINVVRIAALVNYPDYFEQIHVGWGAQLASFSTMLLIIAITLWGARREIFR